MSECDRDGWGIVVVLFLVIGVIIGSQVALMAQRPRAEWVSERCYTNDCIAKTLNSLSADRAAEAKLTTWGNTAGAITYVWYRK